MTGAWHTACISRGAQRDRHAVKQHGLVNTCTRAGTATAGLRPSVPLLPELHSTAQHSTAQAFDASVLLPGLTKPAMHDDSDSCRSSGGLGACEARGPVTGAAQQLHRGSGSLGGPAGSRSWSSTRSTCLRRSCRGWLR